LQVDFEGGEFEFKAFVAKILIEAILWLKKCNFSYFWFSLRF